LTTNLL